MKLLEAAAICEGLGEPYPWSRRNAGNPEIGRQPNLNGILSAEFGNRNSAVSLVEGNSRQIVKGWEGPIHVLSSGWLSQIRSKLCRLGGVLSLSFGGHPCPFRVLEAAPNGNGWGCNPGRKDVLVKALGFRVSPLAARAAGRRGARRLGLPRLRVRALCRSRSSGRFGGLRVGGCRRVQGLGFRA